MNRSSASALVVLAISAVSLASVACGGSISSPLGSDSGAGSGGDAGSGFKNGGGPSGGSSGTGPSTGTGPSGSGGVNGGSGSGSSGSSGSSGGSGSGSGSAGEVDASTVLCGCPGSPGAGTCSAGCENLSCDYGNTQCFCSGGGWLCSSGGGGPPPPPPSCPATEPTPGSSCAGNGGPIETCSYGKNTCVCVPTNAGEQWSCT